MNKEQLLELLRDKLSIRVEIKDGSYSLDKNYVKVKLLLDDEVISEDSDCIIVKNY